MHDPKGPPACPEGNKSALLSYKREDASFEAGIQQVRQDIKMNIYLCKETMNDIKN